MKRTIDEWIPLLVKPTEQGHFRAVEVGDLWPFARRQDKISSCEFRAVFSLDSSARKALLDPMELVEAKSYLQNLHKTPRLGSLLIVFRN